MLALWGVPAAISLAGCGSSEPPVAASGGDDPIVADSAGGDSPLPSDAIVEAAIDGGFVPGTDIFTRVHAWPGDPRVFLSFTASGEAVQTRVVQLHLGDRTVAPLTPGAGGVDLTRRFPGLLHPMPGETLIWSCEAGPFVVDDERGDPIDPRPLRTNGAIFDGFDTLSGGSLGGSRVSPPGTHLVASFSYGDTGPPGVVGFVELSSGAFDRAWGLPVLESIEWWTWRDDHELLLAGRTGVGADAVTWWTLRTDTKPYRAEAAREPRGPGGDDSPWELLGFVDARAVRARDTEVWLGEAVIARWAPTGEPPEGPRRRGTPPRTRFLGGVDGQVVLADRAGDGWPLVAASGRDPRGPRRVSRDIVAAAPVDWVMAVPWPESDRAAIDFICLHRTRGLFRLHGPLEDLRLEPVAAIMSP